MNQKEKNRLELPETFKILQQFKEVFGDKVTVKKTTEIRGKK